jgi:outer membrane protein assembly factor BamB
MFGRNLQHAGRSVYVGSETPVLKWSFNITGQVGSSLAIGVDGTIYVVSINNKLYAIIKLEVKGCASLPPQPTTPQWLRK